MGRKIVSALIMFLVFIPIIFIGGALFNVCTYIISLFALNEFISIKCDKKMIPLFVKVISFISFSFLIFCNIKGESLILSIDYRVLSSIFLLFLIPTILYHDRSFYSVNDSFYLIGGVLFLGISFSLLILLRNISLNMFVYSILIAVFTDIYSFITGNLVGKRVLIGDVSPCKTIEGMIGGIAFGTFVPVVYYFTVSNTSINLFLLVFITLFLSILASIGDLCFSAIKRYFDKKDFSNIIPGHGGILDRFDSIIFVLLGFMFFINIIGG